MRDEIIRLSGFEAQLAALSPQANLDRDRVMFAAGAQAGRAKARRTSRWLVVGNLLFATALVASWTAPPDPRPAIARPDAWSDNGIATLAPRTTAGVVENGASENRGPTHLQLMHGLAGATRASDVIAAAAGPSAASGPRAEPSEARVLLHRYIGNGAESL